MRPSRDRPAGHRSSSRCFDGEPHAHDDATQQLTSVRSGGARHATVRLKIEFRAPTNLQGMQHVDPRPRIAR
jgi:hypothetical protein